MSKSSFSLDMEALYVYVLILYTKDIIYIGFLIFYHQPSHLAVWFHKWTFGINLRG